MRTNTLAMLKTEEEFCIIFVLKFYMYYSSQLLSSILKESSGKDLVGSGSWNDHFRFQNQFFCKIDIARGHSNSSY